MLNEKIAQIMTKRKEDASKARINNSRLKITSLLKEVRMFYYPIQIIIIIKLLLLLIIIIIIINYSLF